MQFTQSETNIISLLASGYTDIEISQILFFSRNYVRKKFHKIIKKYNLKNRCHLVAAFIISCSTFQVDTGNNCDLFL